MLSVTYAPLDELVAHERNPKAHDVELIAGSLARFGFIDPVVIDERTGKLAAGHGRLKALQHLRDTEQPPPDGIDTGDNGAWLVPRVVGWSSANDLEAEAALIALNRTTEVGGWDGEALLALLDDLQNAPDGLAGVGYDRGDIDELRSELDAARAVSLEDDDPPPLPEVPTAALGDVWEVGPHRVVCGDATDPLALGAAVGDGPVDAVWTDPPYGIDYVEEGSRHRKIANDDLGIDALAALLRDALEPLLAVTKPGAPWYVASPSGPELLAFALVLTELKVWRQTIVWAKDRLVLARSDYHGQHESVLFGATPGADPRVDPDPDEVAAYAPDHAELLYGWTPGGAHPWWGGRKQTTVWTIPRPARSDLHPTMKPLELIGRSLLNSTLPGELVVDPFAGSGSTLVAAARVGRVGAGIELDPGYVDVIVARLEDETGEPAVRSRFLPPKE